MGIFFGFWEEKETSECPMRISSFTSFQDLWIKNLHYWHMVQSFAYGKISKTLLIVCFVCSQHIAQCSLCL